MKKVILVIKDGWGHRKEKSLNAISKANTPDSDYLEKKYPSTILKASGKAVGLPEGYQGNSEVGHLTIGSGRVTEESLTRINRSIKEGSFFKKREFLNAVNNCKKNKSCLHLIGLLQKEGVHSHINHLFALLDLCKKQRFNQVYMHIITDGRDAPVKRGKKYLKEVVQKIKKTELGQITTISGRYYAMDRDNRWDRTKKAYNTIVEGKSANIFDNPTEELEKCYKKGETDEFILPRTAKGYKGIKDKDSVIFYNFRTDRTRQLTKSIIEKKFNLWKRNFRNVFFVAMTNYYEPMNAEVAFKEIKAKNILGEVLSSNNIKQLRISETEKYAHVTFFFNGQKEKPFKKEERIMIPSPKVATYDKKPEMSAFKILKRVVEEIRKGKYEFILVNFVNADMVGHTGNIKAIKKAVEAVDKAVGKLVKEGLSSNYTLLITSDHGNAEDQTEEWRTSHTTNPVPFTIVSGDKKIRRVRSGKGLKDIAPTILKLMKIKKPKEMRSSSILY